MMISLAQLRPRLLHLLLLVVYHKVFLLLDLSVGVVNKTNCHLMIIVQKLIQTKPEVALKIKSEFEKPCCFHGACEYFIRMVS